LNRLKKLNMAWTVDWAWCAATLAVAPVAGGQMTRPALRGKRWLFYQAPSTRLASPAPNGASR
jgi:hypothetical protein